MKIILGILAAAVFLFVARWLQKKFSKDSSVIISAPTPASAPTDPATATALKTYADNIKGGGAP